MKRLSSAIFLLAALLLLTAAVLPAAGAEEWVQAWHSPQTIFLNGEEAALTAYNVNGNNYVQLRELGKVIGFNVSWDAASRTVQVDTLSPYTDPAVIPAAPDDAWCRAYPSAQAIYINGIKYRFDAYNVNGNNYLKLRDVGLAMEFDVTWDAENRRVLVTTGTEYSGLGLVWLDEKIDTVLVETYNSLAEMEQRLEEINSSLTSPVSSSASPLDEEHNTAFCREVLRLINEARKAAGVQELAESKVLMKSAREYVETKPEAHDPQLSYEILSRSGCKHAVTENLKWLWWEVNDQEIMKHAKETFDGWNNSPGHYRTMMNSGADTAGVGLYIDSENNRGYCVLYIGSCKLGAKLAAEHPEAGLGAAHD